jgi:hypothetical protein
MKLEEMKTKSSKKFAEKNFLSRTFWGAEIKYWLIALALSPIAYQLRELAIS